MKYEYREVTVICDEKLPKLFANERIASVSISPPLPCMLLIIEKTIPFKSRIKK